MLSILPVEDEGWLGRVVRALGELPRGATAREVSLHLGVDPDSGQYATVAAALSKAVRRGIATKTRDRSPRRNSPLCGYRSRYTLVSSLPSAD